MEYTNDWPTSRHDTLMFLTLVFAVLISFASGHLFGLLLSLAIA